MGLIMSNCHMLILLLMWLLLYVMVVGSDDSALFMPVTPILGSRTLNLKSSIDDSVTLNGTKTDDCSCFNCLLPKYKCTHFANCSSFSGRCECPDGFGGDDCLDTCLYTSICVISI